MVNFSRSSEFPVVQEIQANELQERDIKEVWEFKSFKMQLNVIRWLLIPTTWTQILLISNGHNPARPYSRNDQRSGNERKVWFKEIQLKRFGKDGLNRSVPFSTLDPRVLDLARHEALGNSKRMEPNSTMAE